MTRALQPCGTPAAYQRHKRRREPVDQACQDARRAYGRRLRSRPRPHPTRPKRRAAGPDKPTGSGVALRAPDPALAAVGAVDRCGLDLAQAAALLGVSVGRLRALLAEGRRRVPRAAAGVR